MPVATHIQDSMTKASWIRKMFERGAELKGKHGAENIYDFTLGNPILEPPKEFFQGLADLSKRQTEGLHRYMPNAGFLHVRENIAKHLVEHKILPQANADLIVMTTGAGGGLNVCLKTILNPGDEVILLAPYFVEYMFYVKNHGGVPVVAQTNDCFELDLDAIQKAITKNTKAIIVNSPNNPTGRMYAKASLQSLSTLLREMEKKHKHPIYVVSDEPYRELIYTEQNISSAAAFHHNAFLVYSWSKSLSIPGERIGYVAVNPQAEDAPALANGLTFSNRTLGFVNAPASMQLLAAQLLSVTIDVNWYRERRDRCVEGLMRAGMDVQVPDGTFYVFPKSPEPDEISFVNHAMEERVLLVPGSGFGRKEYFRICYCVDDHTLKAGLEALAKVMRRYSN